jgi:hypothetical protein
VLDCEGTTIDLEEVATTPDANADDRYDNGRKQITFKGTNNGYTYAWIIPICGADPGTQDLPGGTWKKQMAFNPQSVLQWTENPHNRGLGIYYSTTWKYGTIDDQYALMYMNYNGDQCKSNRQYRQTQINLICDYDYSASAPKLVADEPSSCICKSIISIVMVCSKFIQHV